MTAPTPTTSCRIGLGYDIHRTTDGDHVWLGGMRVAAPFSLVGHSDADVLLHAITDAILGALADYDIGHYFPPNDSINKNRSSREFVNFALERMRAKRFRIANLDCNIICEEPRIALVRQEIRMNLSSMLRVDISQISVKGRSNERVDAVGRREALACQAVVLVEAVRA